MSHKDQGQELVHLLEGEDYLEEDEEECIQSVSGLQSPVSYALFFNNLPLKNEQILF